MKDKRVGDLYIARIEVGKLPTIYRVDALRAVVTNLAHKTIREVPSEPRSWLAYPRNPELSRIAACAIDTTPETALSAARKLLITMGRR